jgi:DNA-binding transcriptional regulator WhiA
MSFAAETKAALCDIKLKKMCCKTALLLGILRAANLFSDREIRFTTRSRQTAALTVRMLIECFGDISAAGFTDESELLSVVGDDADSHDAEEGGESYQIVLTGAQAAVICECFPLSDDGRWGAMPHEGSLCPQCRIAYLRGIFLSCGNVTDPAAYYHLDMVLAEDDMAETLGYYLEEFGLPPKHTARKGMPVLYYKESEAIEDFLTTIGAQKASLSVMEAKIMKSMRNDANRAINCEIANMGKTAKAAATQYEAIREMIEADRLRLLPVELQQTARLRYDNPELTLKDLAALHNPPLTKSGLNHRLKKIVDFAGEGGNT